MSETVYHSKSGMTFEKKIVTDNSMLTLVSIGTRKKIVFVVYGIGFYSNNPSLYEDGTIDETAFDNEDKNILVLKFYRGVDNVQIAEAFSEAIGNRSDGFDAERSAFMDIFKEINELKYQDSIELKFYGDELHVVYNGDEIGNIVNSDFNRVLFSVFTDNASVTPDLREQ